MDCCSVGNCPNCEGHDRKNTLTQEEKRIVLDACTYYLNQASYYCLEKESFEGKHKINFYQLDEKLVLLQKAMEKIVNNETMKE